MGVLSFSLGKFRFAATDFSKRGGVALENQLAKEAGLQWNADTLRWVTRNPDKALGLRQWADLSAERKFKKHFITEYALPEQIIYPDHLSPRTFQIESAWHCVTRSPAYCADEAGLGKTVTSILCMNTVPGKTLIICPPFLKYSWAFEIQKWLLRPATIGIMDGGKAISNDKLWDADVVIVPDSLITNPLLQSMITNRKWMWMFVDEAHRYKEATTQRTQALVGEEDDGRGIRHAATRIVLLSGTPIPNGRPIELYPLLSQLAPESIDHQSALEYGQSFCGAKRVVRYEGRKAIVNWDFRGQSNLNGLRAKLREKLMIRHLKKNVLKELGPKTRQIIFLDEVKRLHELEKRVLTNRTLEELMGEDCELGDIATYRREVGEAKLEQAAAYIHDLLENSPDKLVVFAHHIDVVEGLQKALRGFGALMIRGGMTAKDKHLRAARFQSRPEHRLIVGNMDAMGVGLTLTQAPGVIIVEPSWVPGINEQAEDRVHRMTQKSNVYCRYLVLRNSLDERMLHSVLSKQDAINKVMD